ncbi:ATPase [Campylobacter sp. RM13119]|uniref:DUF234 domain-containing protein n=1 Tax=Campylobacter TaxID=194 RepID=UPI00147394EB|nr:MULTISPECIES: DUF234 domain-containing protein [unclassified Campylobacter]MBE3021541.1 ATPase [Campylobacter sp. 7477a]MBE3605759.1 ATPase [Campylobacter sp. RM13119]MBE3609774.1 ATPase [Campylobacter sp. RM12916]
MKHLEIDELIKFHLVFDDFELKGSYYDVFEAIESEILKNYKNFMARFYFQSDREQAIKSALIKLARSDRKKFNILKILPKNLANKVYAELFKKDFLFVEKSREEPVKRIKHQSLKKSERRYKIEDKMHFSSHFSRFWFRFIEPNLELLKNGDEKKLLEIIKSEFDQYASLGFELLCGELMAKILGIKDHIDSFWKKRIEIDIFLQFNDKLVVGEAKYKERKICKNILNLLLYKCKKLDINPDIIMLFSRNGFSKELRELKDERVRLYEIKDFERLLND